MRFPQEQDYDTSIQMNHPSFELQESSKTNQDFSISSFDDQQNRMALGNQFNQDEARKNKIIKWIGFSILILIAAYLIKLYFFTQRQSSEDYSDWYENWMGEPNIPVQKPRKLSNEQKAIRKQCYKLNQLRHKVFFISFDQDSMAKDEVTNFNTMNKICHFVVIPESSLDYYVEIWNQREETIRFDQKFINLTVLAREQKRLLLIWLQLYYWPGTYLHPSLGVNFGKHISDRYLFNAQSGTQLLFAKYDHQNEKGILVPERNFKTVKVGERFSRRIREIILKIIAKQDWMDICETQQCGIIKDALQFPDEL